MKTEEEERQRLEAKMKADRQSFEEGMKQIAEAKERESSRSQEEFERALESKMREQKEMMEKGFCMQAERLMQEIEETKRKHEENQAEQARQHELMLENLRKERQDQEHKHEQAMTQMNQQHTQTLTEMKNQHEQVMAQIQAEIINKERIQAKRDEGFAIETQRLLQELELTKKENADNQAMQAKAIEAKMEEIRKDKLEVQQRHEKEMATLKQQHDLRKVTVETKHQDGCSVQ